MGLQNCYRGFSQFAKMKIYGKMFVEKNVFKNISENFEFFKNAENMSKTFLI